MSQSFLDREGVIIVVVALVVLSLLVAGGYYLLNPPEPVSSIESAVPSDSSGIQSPDTVAYAIAKPMDASKVFEYAGQDGETVLDLLKADHSVELDSELLLFGSIVLAIDSFVAEPGYFWLYYRDSLRGDRSPEVCTTHSAERIRWVIQKRK